MEKSQYAPPPSTGPYPQSQSPPYIPQQQGQPYPQPYPQPGPQPQPYPQMYPQQQPPPTVQLQSAPNVVTIQTMSMPDSQRNAHYNSKGSIRTGWLMIVIGILCIVLGIVAIVIKCHMAEGGTAIWTGLLFFLVTGILGVHAGKTKGTCAIVGYMVMCIITCCMAFNAFIVLIVAACLESSDRYCDYDYSCDPYWVCNQICDFSPNYGGRVAVDVILVFCSFTEMITCIVGSALCCRGVCCRPNVARNQSMVHYQPQQVVIAAPGQPVTHGNVMIQQYTVAAPLPSAPPSQPQYGDPAYPSGQMTYATPQDRPPAYSPVYNQAESQPTPGAPV